MSVKLLSALFTATLVSSLAATPVALKNQSIQLTVHPEAGGKITELQSKDFSFSLPQDKVLDVSSGLAKFRIFGDNGNYMKQKWNVISKSERSVTMKISGLQPERNLEITKKITLPETGNYVKVELNLKNRNPIEGGFKVVPWIHSAFKPEPANGWTFLLSHQKGVEQLKLNQKLKISHALNQAGNWIFSYHPEKKQGLLLISENRPEVVYNFIAENIASLEMLYPVVDPTHEKNIVYYLAPLAALNAEAVAATKIPVKLSPAFTAKHTAGNTVDVLSYFKSAGEKNYPVNFKFWKDTAYVSPDIALPLTFGIRKIKSGKIAFEVDLPDFIQLTGHSGNYWTHVNEDMKLLESKSITRNGIKYNRHRFEVTCRTLAHWFHSHCRILVKAAKNEGSGVIYYRGFHNGKQSMEASVPCNVIRIPAAQTPQKFKVLMGIDYGLLHAWQNYLNTMKYLGINGVCVDWSVPNKVITADQVKAMNSRLKKAGLMTSVMGIFYVPAERGYEVAPKLRTIDINGKPANAFDFTLRGSWMDKTAQHAANHMKLGYDLIISDYEPYFGGDRYSFTKNTLDAFKKFFTGKYPALKYIEPQEVTRNSGRYPQHYKIWVQFKCDQFADYLKTVIENSRRMTQNSPSVGLCTIPGASDESIRIDNLCDNQQFNAVLDYNMPMLYNNLYQSMKNYRNEIDLFRKMAAGKRAVVFPTLSLGFWGSAHLQFPPEHSYFQLLETALTQCNGAYIFPGFAGSDNLGVMYLSRALNLIAKLEKTIQGAKRQDQQVKVSDCRNTKLNLPAAVEPLVLVNGNKMLVWLAEYSADPVKMNVNFNLHTDCRITSLSGAKISKTLKKNEKLPVTLLAGDHKGLLLQLETLDGTSFPIRETVTEKQETTSDKNLVFHDGFDGSTFGKNGSANHFYQFDSKGKKGACLFMRDYESYWILPQEFNIPSGEVTIDFYFMPSRNFGPGTASLRDLMRGYLGQNQMFWIFFDNKTGKICFALGRLKNGKVADWTIRALSATDRWPAHIWMSVKLHMGKSGIKLSVDGKDEINLTKPIRFNSLRNVQIGRPFVSSGRFDELKIYNQ